MDPFSSSHLAQLLRDHSIEVRPPGQEFRLAAGGTSRVYCDTKKTVMGRQAIIPMADLFLEVIKSNRFGTIAAVAGVELGGCHLASSVAARAASLPGSYAWLDTIYVRKHSKDHGTRNLVERPAGIPDGARVLLLEDVVTTGGSSLRAATALIEDGLDLAGVLAIVDRRDEPSDAIGDFPFGSLYRLSDLVDGGVK